MSVAEDTAVVTSNIHVGTEKLVAEIARYLAVVEVFRSADCEPTWRPETVGALPPDVQLVEHVRSAH